MKRCKTKWNQAKLQTSYKITGWEGSEGSTGLATTRRMQSWPAARNIEATWKSLCHRIYRSHKIYKRIISPVELPFPIVWRLPPGADGLHSVDDLPYPLLLQGRCSWPRPRCSCSQRFQTQTQLHHFAVLSLAPGPSHSAAEMEIKISYTTEVETIFYMTSVTYSLSGNTVDVQ